MNPLWGLAFIGALAGALSMRVFRRISDREAIRESVNRIQAYLLEFWLFVDDPSLIWKSWRGLLAANARLLRLLAVPVLVLSPPMAPLFYCLDSSFGHLPIPIGRPALVTVQLNQNLDALLTAPDGIAIETAPLRVLSERQVSWRIRPARPLSGALQCTVAGRSMEKSVAAGPGFRFLSQRRVRRALDLLRYPTETPLQAGPVDWIEVSYPPSTMPLLGLDAHWSVWFAASFLIGAILPGDVYRKPHHLG
jgi:hypothetical protein